MLQKKKLIVFNASIIKNSLQIFNWATKTIEENSKEGKHTWLYIDGCRLVVPSDDLLLFYSKVESFGCVITIAINPSYERILHPNFEKILNWSEFLKILPITDTNSKTLYEELGLDKERICYINSLNRYNGVLITQKEFIFI